LNQKKLRKEIIILLNFAWEGCKIRERSEREIERRSAAACPRCATSDPAIFEKTV
jgi:hypothetical protein